ncbi:MAG: 16S rRNA (guanine(966)-N(2))-methyltransferase RsmD, partial [Alphaproteobacteria bacterium]
MRIVAGRHRGRRLAAPPGRAVRPTGARVREALFDMLAHNPWGPGGAPLPRGQRVVDAFAGSGALGFEALSRGAARVVFLEIDAEAARGLSRTAHMLDEEDAVAVLQRDATRPGPAEAPAALVFLDPPYRSGLAAPALAELARMGWLAPGALAVVELAAKEVFDPPDGFAAVAGRRYGDTRIV